MATFALVDATTWIAGHDFTTDTNQITFSVEAEELDKTAFGSGGFRSRIAGLRDISAELAGFWQSAASGAVDPESFPDLGVANRVLTASPTGDAGDVAYTCRVGKFGYSLGGAVGEVMPFTLTARGSNGVGVVRGRIAAARQTVNATGAVGSVLNLGAVGADQHLFVSVHVFSAGTDVTIDVESDDAAGFASATARGTIGPLTAPGGTWMAQVAGPITDTHWRLRVTDIDGSFDLAGVIGIQ